MQMEIARAEGRVRLRALVCPEAVTAAERTTKPPPPCMLSTALLLTSTECTAHTNTHGETCLRSRRAITPEEAEAATHSV